MLGAKNKKSLTVKKEKNIKSTIEAAGQFTRDQIKLRLNPLYLEPSRADFGESHVRRTEFCTVGKSRQVCKKENEQNEM